MKKIILIAILLITISITSVGCGLWRGSREIPNEPACITEGYTIPVIPNAPNCCSGLSLISPMKADIVGIFGICTAKCGNHICDTATETNYNCPGDCIITSNRTNISNSQN